jgi:hypothetical protein
MVPIFNIPYSPEFNGIESYFSILKNEYKKLLLKHLLSDSEFETLTLVRQSIKLVSDDKVRACARYGREAIEK